jgi:DNA polymerase-3 subunit delta'
MTDALYQGIVGQEPAINLLRGAAARPVHAYLLVGPPGSGKRAAAVSFAAALLCPSTPPDGTCDSCQRALAGLHPDVIEVEREGAFISIDAAREVIRVAATSPVEGERKVVILHDFHLVQHAGPALLKTIEEPPATTVFVILAEYVPAELVTIASRCVRVDFRALGPSEVAAILQAEGVDPDRAPILAGAAGGRLDRARLLASDPQFEARRRAWEAVPTRLDGTGATAAVVAAELVALLEASVEPLRRQHEEQRTTLDERNARSAEVAGGGKAGKAGARAAKAMLNAGVAEMEATQKRAQRRQRTDELRGGLAALAGAYRDRLADATDTRRRAAALRAIDQIDRLGRDLEFNPGELLALQALLTRLDRAALQA